MLRSLECVCLEHRAHPAAASLATRLRYEQTNKKKPSESTPVQLTGPAGVCITPASRLQTDHFHNSNVFQCACMNQACEESSPFPNIPEEGGEEAVLYRQSSPDGRPPQMLLVFIWDSRIYFMSPYAALRASPSCVGRTDRFLLHFLPSHYVSLPAVTSSNLASTEIICVRKYNYTAGSCG